MILPINESPIIRTYSHHGYVNSIIDQPVLLSMNVSGLTEKKWSTFIENLRLIENENNIIAYSSGELGKKRYYTLERFSETNDEINITIYQLENMQRDAKIIIYISGKRNSHTYCDMMYSLTLHQYGFTSDEFGVNRKNYEYTILEYPFLKITRKNRKVFFMCSKNKLEWEIIDECILTENVQEYFFGITAVNLDSDEYIEWLMSNYISLSFDPRADKTQVYLDYALMPCKNMKYEYIYPSQFLDISYISAGTICWKDMVAFIKNSIDKGYYVAIAQDEYFIPNRKTYQKVHMYHHNLFWGYDDGTENFYILGYGKKYSTSCYSYADFLNAGISKDANVVLYRKDYNDNRFYFSKESFLLSLYKFLNGDVPYKEMTNVMGIREMVYGIQVFRALSETEKGLWVACFDNRAAYLILEHSSLWLRRVDFLIDRGYLEKDNKAKSVAENLVEISEKFLFFVQRNMVGAYSISFHTPNELWNKVEADKIRQIAKTYLKKLETMEYELIITIIEGMGGLKW